MTATLLGLTSVNLLIKGERSSWSRDISCRIYSVTAQCDRRALRSRHIRGSKFGEAIIGSWSQSKSAEKRMRQKEKRKQINRRTASASEALSRSSRSLESGDAERIKDARTGDSFNIDKACKRA